MAYKLLSVNADAKTIKGVEYGYLTGILYLAPHTIASEKSLCPHSTPECRATCLFTAGRASIFPKVNEARMRKTRLFLTDRVAFGWYLTRDILALEREARRRNLIPAVRLNGTSDIMWERETPKLFQAFSHVQFYDYTKIPLRHRANRPSNYHLTFSASESNQSDVQEAINSGVNATVVFKTDLFPTFYMGRPVVSGDDSDLRFLDSPGLVHDGKGLIIGLKAKGKARKQATGGFVR